MKKFIILILLVICLGGCQSTLPECVEADYYKEEKQIYDNGKSSMKYEGKYFDAKLMSIKRYVLDNGRLNYEYKLYLLPKVKLDSKTLYLQVLKTSILKEYYGGQEKQHGYDEIMVPIKLKKDKTHCYELTYNILSNNLSDIGEQNWNHEMNSIQIQLKWGTHKEVITFYQSVNITYGMKQSESNINCSVIR
ncbi:MAG: hypothetical protein RSC93_13220 [Erysipelotrichaceae bacterium]